ncbi:MAG: hypothetical protein AMQ22_01972 [Candidatus Methanofastidiosum methylothiophilum]|uniref:Lin1244/Lin1753-like N-terminal domain-containing protein n=1 Tax=Candidatus Methanofastidiosum methylothiophilum TaxID=1705564 RepID=A0A150IRC9_9EURY|nr:MAG: hypothetical protein AMQ22_01972 [Candidatus Methanofastidiosum methylthiophilus]
MGRPTKTGLDYFPVDIDIFTDEKIEFVSIKYGLEGEAIIFRLLAKIYRAGYFIQWNNDVLLLFCGNLKKVDEPEDLVNKVITELLKREFFSQELYDKFQILTGSGIQKRYIKACEDSKRKTIEIIPEYSLLRVNPELNIVNSEFKAVNSELTRVNSEFSAQSKVKESKVKENRVKESKESKVNETITPLHFENSPSLTFYDYEPKNYNSSDDIEESITKLAQKYCSKFILTPSELIRFRNLVINAGNITRKDAFRVLFECFEEYPKLDFNKKNLPYLSTRIQGKIDDAIKLAPIIAREKAAERAKNVELKEANQFLKNQEDDTIDNLLEHMSYKTESAVSENVVK